MGGSILDVVLWAIGTAAIKCLNWIFRLKINLSAGGCTVVGLIFSPILFFLLIYLYLFCNFLYNWIIQ
jgi:hypothetical protein